MADNMVDGAGSGISVTNFDFKHGRLASVHGNVLRNLHARAASAPPQDFGLGLHRRRRHRGDRQCHRGRGLCRHARRLGALSAQRGDHR